MRIRVIYDERGTIVAAVHLDTPAAEGVRPVIQKEHTDHWGALKEADLDVPAEHSHMDFATVTQKLKVDAKGKSPKLTRK